MRKRRRWFSCSDHCSGCKTLIKLKRSYAFLSTFSVCQFNHFCNIIIISKSKSNSGSVSGSCLFVSVIICIWRKFWTFLFCKLTCYKSSIQSGNFSVAVSIACYGFSGICGTVKAGFRHKWVQTYCADQSR